MGLLRETMEGMMRPTRIPQRRPLLLDFR